MLERFRPEDFTESLPAEELRAWLRERGVLSDQKQRAYEYFKEWFEPEPGDYLGCEYVLYPRGKEHRHSAYMVAVGALTFEQALQLARVAGSQNKQLLQALPGDPAQPVRVRQLSTPKFDALFR